MFHYVKILTFVLLISSVVPQCSVTSADNTAMSNWALSMVKIYLRSSVTCSVSGTCLLMVSYATPTSSILTKVKEYVNFILADSSVQTQTFTSIDANNGMRTLSVNFSVSQVSGMKAAISVNTSLNTITYSFSVNILLVNYCLSMGLASLNGNIILSINSQTNTVFNTRSSMLQSNLPSCPPPGCTVSSTFFLNQGICDDSSCASISPSKNYKLGDAVYIKAILPDSLKTLKFKLYMATYAVLSPEGNNIYQSDNILSTITEKIYSGYNVESWVIPVTTEVVGPNGAYSGNVRSISLNMFFTLVTSRGLRYLLNTVEVSQAMNSTLNLPPNFFLNTTSNINSTNTTSPIPIIVPSPTTNNTNLTKNDSNSSYYKYLSGIGLLSLIIYFI